MEGTDITISFQCVVGSTEMVIANVNGRYWSLLVTGVIFEECLINFSFHSWLAGIITWSLLYKILCAPPWRIKSVKKVQGASHGCGSVSSSWESWAQGRKLPAIYYIYWCRSFEASEVGSDASWSCIKWNFVSLIMNALLKM